MSAPPPKHNRVTWLEVLALTAFALLVFGNLVRWIVAHSPNLGTLPR